MTNNLEQDTNLRDKISETVEYIEFLNDNKSYISKRGKAIDDLVALIKQRENKIRLDENAWSRGQMIALQAYEAPNSGFGRMVRTAIKIFNERKLKLISDSEEQL